MHVISRKRLVDFGEHHADAVKPLDAWYRLMKARRFTDSAELKDTFATAGLLAKTLVSFDIAGNRYRLITNVHYATETNVGRLWIRHIFTHAGYDRWSTRRT